jgi:hypothetical protein
MGAARETGRAASSTGMYRLAATGSQTREAQDVVAPSGACFLLVTFLCAVQGGTNVARAQDARSDHEQRKVTCRGSTTHKYISYIDDSRERKRTMNRAQRCGAIPNYLDSRLRGNDTPRE